MYACTHLANSASLLLPVSNLTNLLAFAASGLAFGRFAALMAVPWLAAIAVEYAVFRPVLRLRPGRRAAGPIPARARRCRCSPSPWWRCTLAGFVGRLGGGRQPGLGRVRGRRGARRPRAGPAPYVTPVGVGQSAADLPFLLFVLGLGIVVRR